VAKTAAAQEWQTVGTMEHLGGIPFYQAPIPARFHFCKPQTRATIKGKFVEWCSCAAYRNDRGPWQERNTARRNRASSFQ
jgi:hypothetical protein